MPQKIKQNQSDQTLNIALNESEDARIFLRTILDAQTSMIVVISEHEIVDVNKSFLDFFNVASLEYFLDNVSASLGALFEDNGQSHYLHNKRDGMSWIEYVLHYSNETHKVLMHGRVFKVDITEIKKEEYPIFTVSFSDITDLEQGKLGLESSIEYASLIQHSLVPNNEVFRKYVEEFFVIWHPKDVVGGDIYLLEELRTDDEMLLMVIDCAGHGVPGAFVTMLVKAIERQIVGRINYSDEVVDPAKILSIFNKSMKHLLKQEDKTSISNAGFDGGVLYYNRIDNQITYAGAKTPLYVVQNGELEVYKGDRQSIGYKRSNPEFEFTNYVIDIEEDAAVYLTTDGFLDQAGGEEGYPFGKTRFTELIKAYAQESFSDQQEVFLDELLEHQDERKANDDITVIGLRFSRYNNTNKE